MDTNGEKINCIAEEWYKSNLHFCKDKEELISKLESWLGGAEPEEAEILLELFAHSKYFSKRKVYKIFLDFYKNLRDKGHTFFTAIESQQIRQNSSHIYLNEFALVSGVPEYNVIPMLIGLAQKDLENLKYIKQIVFIDDIVGTGKTVEDYFKKIKEIIAGKKIFLWVVCITEYAKHRIEQYARENNIEIEICAYGVEKKAFQGGYIFDLEEASRNELIIADLEKRLWKDRQVEEDKKDEFVLGKDKSQCLLSFYNDTPNNTLSSFWFCNDSWKPIFKRKKKQEPLWLKDKKRERTNRNYEHRK